jgi:lysozyme family protein
MKTINEIIDKVIHDEAGFIDHPNDPGGATMYGITEKVARKHGYKGHMRELPLSIAKAIYYHDYVIDPGFDKVLLLSPDVAAELVDTGVNLGQSTASEFFQQLLNTFNLNGKLYADIGVDGDIGPATINAFAAYLRERKDKGVSVMLKGLNCLQGAHYVAIAKSNKKLEDFTFGWFSNRVQL